MKAPKTLAQLRESCAMILAGAVNGDVKLDEGRLALNAATRIIESCQLEVRARALAFASNQIVPDQISLDGPMMRAPTITSDPIKQIEAPAQQK